MRISDWSSDVCSSDPRHAAGPGARADARQAGARGGRGGEACASVGALGEDRVDRALPAAVEVVEQVFGRALLALHPAAQQGEEMALVVTLPVEPVARLQIGRAHV